MVKLQHVLHDLAFTELFIKNVSCRCDDVVEYARKPKWHDEPNIRIVVMILDLVSVWHGRGCRWFVEWNASECGE